MTWLDNLIGWLSPETGYRRDAFRRAMEAEKIMMRPAIKDQTVTGV